MASSTIGSVLVGGIHYDVTLDTSKLIGQSRVVERETAKVAGGFNVITSAIKVMAVALSAVQFARMADDMRLLSSRVEVAAGSIEKGAAAMRELISISTRTQTAVAANAQVFQRLNGSLLQMGGTQADTLRVTELLGMAIKVSGASATETSSAMLQFGQALGSGKLAGDELRSLLENAPYLMRQLADGLGVPIGALKKMGEEGKLTADAVVNALGKAAAKIEADFGAMPQTLAAVWQVAMDALDRLVEKSDEASGGSAVLSGVVKGLGQTMDALATQIGRANDASEKFARETGIETWARATRTALSYVVDAADWVAQKFNLMIEKGRLFNRLVTEPIFKFANRDYAKSDGTSIYDRSRKIDISPGEDMPGGQTAGERMRAAWDTEGWDGGGPNRGRAIPGSKLKPPSGDGGAKKRKAETEKEIKARQDLARMARDDAAEQAADAANQAELEIRSRQDLARLAREDAAEQAADAAAEDRNRTQAAAVDTLVGGDPVARLQLRLQRESEAIDLAARKDLENASLYASAKVALEQQTADQIAAIRQREADQQAMNNIVSVAMMADTAAQIYGLLEKSGRERSALGKALFLTSKALAVAEIILNTEVAATKAGAQLGIYGLPMAAMIRATGYASAGLVAGLAVGQAFGGGRQYGGQVNSDSLYRVNETGRPEMFTAANGNQFMLPTSGGRVTAADKVGGGGVQVVVNNYTGADVQASTSDDGRVITIAVRQAVAEVAGQISSHSGSVWTSLRGATNVQARL